jgi:hypothetical protein
MLTGGACAARQRWFSRWHQRGRQYKLALYDLRRDPGERCDVKEFFPGTVAQLQQLAETAREDMGDAITTARVKITGIVVGNNKHWLMADFTRCATPTAVYMPPRRGYICSRCC